MSLYGKRSSIRASPSRTAMQRPEYEKFANEPIAIIGSACRFPGGSTSPSKLWKLLHKPHDVLKETSRFSVDGFYHPNNAHHGTTNVRHTYSLEEDIGVFDAQFFGIKPVEANSMDPQQRQLLETVYEGIEAAGLTISQLRGSQTAVYVGVMTNDYADMQIHDRDNVPTYSATGTARSNVSTRVSYFYDWHGPSMVIDTACSSSLVAVHQAVQVLRSGTETDVAVACGTNLIIIPDQSIALSNLKMLSPEGRSRMWDSNANGYARGEGIGAVVLKRLSQAIKDGDHIDCIIRGTQVNQDGKTKGLTMPSATAQAALIRATYKQAGLDVSRASDRPQFFECHGTGTPAGDPIEAEAIHTAFYSNGDENSNGKSSGDVPLYVGSIKTVVGHTEGAAGIAAILKASLALQHRCIPPNLLFDTLNPKIRPFYANVEVATIQAKPWPALAPGAVPRVSVNSFGFGGSNAHAVLEAYVPEPDRPIKTISGSDVPVIAALNFSAASESALRATLSKYADFLDENKSINVRGLAWTLNTRRSRFAVRTTVYGTTASELSQRLRTRAQAESKILVQVPPKLLSSKPQILGVFTGQGAQWAAMGANLLLTIPATASMIHDLERSLRELPDGPTWSLKDEIIATGHASRLNEAAISQPLCTAIQVVLVDLLRGAGLQFAAVVGHSSGEIAAAYAAGYLSAIDAIRIAYYRGYHLHSAQGPKGERGAMIAVGASIADAQEFCDLPAFKGRVSIAASNSSASVTLSGDWDAIERTKDIFEDEKKFVRLLKVDKAYHSHHMLACADAYRKSLVDCNIKVLRQTRNGTIWISSVYGEDALNYRHELSCQYWIENMTKPVLFAQAVEFAAAEKAPFDIAIECGPHPALKGPSLQVLQECLGVSIPYTGLLSRGRDDNEAFAEGLGYIWQALSDNAVDYRSLERFATGPDMPLPPVLSNLPTYAWDHDRIFWHESRQYMASRKEAEPIHELLGTKCPDGSEQQHRWRNRLRPSEIPWLADHQIQGQVVFPAAGYVSTALEAAKLLTRGQAVKVMEIDDFVIGQALTFNDEYASVETQFTLTDITINQGLWHGFFSFYSASQRNPMVMDRNAFGKISVVLGEPEENVLPRRMGEEFNMLEIDSERFYEPFRKVRFDLTGSFKCLSSLHRKMGEATGIIKTPRSTDPAYNLLLHPAALDGSFQSIFLTYCYPGDGRLRSVHLPIGIKKIKINPLLCERTAGKEVSLRFKSTLTSERSLAIQGDVEVYDERGEGALMHVECLQTKPLGNDTADNDTPIFAQAVWDIAEPSRGMSARNIPSFHNEVQLSFDIERVAFYYLRHLSDVATQVDREKAEMHHKIFFEYVDYTVASVKTGTAKYNKREWIDDTHSQVQDIVNKYPRSIDMRLMHAVGEHLVPVVRGTTTMLEYMREDDMLNDLYVHGIGFEEYTENMAEQVRHFSHRYPHMNILEIGAGTGGSTKRIFKKLGKSFRSYTYTDISTGFFEEAKEVFQEFESKMTFKPLNIEKDPTEQGFAEHSYDLVVASLVLHATHEMEVTMKNVRRLLKPGGHVVILELGEYIENRTGLIFGSLPGWWMGYDDNRKLSPMMSEEAWDTCMKKVGFSGVDAITPIPPDLPVSMVVIVGQAVDEYVNFLREPLVPSSLEVLGSHLTIVGGSTSRVAELAHNAATLLEPFYSGVTTVKLLSGVNMVDFHLMGTVLCLTDLDKPIFQDMEADTLKGIQVLFEQSRSCLWITQGCYKESPYQNMSVGMARVVRLEMSHLRYQSLDLDGISEFTASLITEKLLQLEATEIWDQKGLARNMLWSTEVEISYEKGHCFVPRLIRNKVRNDRYNSARRLITKDLSPAGCNIGLRWSGKDYELHEEMPASTEHVIDGRVEIQVTDSTLEAIRVTGTDFAYLVLGTNLRTKEQVFALSPERHSLVRVFDSWTVPCSISRDAALRLMPMIQNHLIALATISEFSSGQTLILLEPGEELGGILSRLAADKDIKIVMTTKDEAKSSNWISIHPNLPQRVVSSKLPMNASCLIVCSNEDRFAEIVVACLPSSCEVHGKEFFTLKSSKIDSFSSMAFIPSNLRLAFVRAHHDVSSVDKKSTVIPVSDLTLGNHPTEETAIFSWISTDTIPVRITPVYTRPLFSADKTYWLVGLTGGLGLSLCEWMVQSGAKYFALTSRNPKVNSRWEKHIRAQGAMVKVYPNDITDRDSVQSLYKRICDELPPIGGVAQGAMVLADAMFIDLDLERVQRVMGPKVKGSMNLEEIFSGTPLEFFVFFSSMASVSGNAGQSIYSAANSFMAALVAQRRKRGLACSVMHLGSIYGNGYVTEHLTQGQQEFLDRSGYMPMSEQDFHQIFAEAVVAGNEISNDNPELMTGLRPAIAGTGDENVLSWYYNPKFSHYVLIPESHSANAVMEKQNVSVKSRLFLATTTEEVGQAIEESFVAKLKSSLQIDAAVSIINMNVDNLGMDSLVAVELRSWFIKELMVEMPVLKILGGFTVSELVTAAQEALDESLIPNLGKEIDPSLKTTLGGQVEQKVPEPEMKPTTATDKGAFTAFDEDEVLPVYTASRDLEVLDQSNEVAQEQHQSLHSGQLPKSTKVSSNPDEMEIGTTRDTSISPPASIIKSGGSSSDRSLDSDPENESMGRSRRSTPPTSESNIDDYFPKKSDNGLERVVPMSFGQARFWFLRIYLEDQATFNITTSIRVDGYLNIENFKRAVRALGRRHEALRTTFFTDKNNQLMQGVLKESEIQLQHTYIHADDEIAAEYTRIKNHHYALDRGEAMQMVLLTLGEDVHQLIIGYHHINMDGISLEVILSDMQKLYYKQRLAPVAMQYPDFSQLQRKEHSSGQWDRELTFWKSEFADLPAPLPILPLSTKIVRSPLTKYACNTSKFNLDSIVSKQIQSVCKKTKTSPFNFFLATFKALLHRYVESDKTDICIGMADGGRHTESVLDSVGFFLNLLPLRFKTDSSQTFHEAVKEARSKVVKALANSRVPIDVLLNEVRAPRAPTHNPLFQAFINYRPGVQDKRQYCGCDIEATQVDTSQTAYDISIDILENPGATSTIYLSGQRELYSKANVEVLSQCYHNFLKAFAKNPALRLGRPSLYDVEAIQKALNVGKGPSLTTAWPETLVHRIDEMIKSYGSMIALKTPHNRLTYNQMTERVIAIASVLKSNGLSKGSRVGVFQDPTSDFFCSLLAILRVGAILIPLELRLGLSRLASMVKDSKLDTILYDKSNQKDLIALGSNFKKINVSLILLKNSAVVPNDAEADSPAVILYTSGSTGTPKGILLSHSSWLNQIQSSSQAWQVDIGFGTHLQHSAWSFDISISQTFVALANGASLFIVPKSQRGDSLAMSRIIVSEGINYVQATPTELVSWLRHADISALRRSNWQFAMSGGEKITLNLIQEFRKLAKSDLRLVNAYGPAEITLAIGSAEVRYETADDLNKPFKLFPNYSVYILDSKMQPVPPGIPGEVFIGGAGVAKGYLNNNALTEECFLLDEFAPPEYITSKWLKMHKSGDCGRLTDEGGLLLEGRIKGDTQIKLRGIRIDLQDIESTLLQEAKGVLREAVVSVRASGESEYLVAHVVVSTDFKGDYNNMLRRLPILLPLPQYMRPAIVVPLTHLPLNHSGKVDRQAIAALLIKPTTKEVTSTTTQRQTVGTKVKEIWQRVLGDELTSLHQIDAVSDFFHIGGNSLTLVNVQGLIKRELNVELTLVQLFENPTLGALIRQIDATSEAINDESISSMTAPEMVEVTPPSFTPAGRIDWAQETAMTDDLYELEIDPEPKDQGLPFKTVVITGATGFLGKELIRQMIDDTHIDKIHAIAVRWRKSDLPAIFSNPKVDLHQGDLKAPRLGLSEAKARKMFAETDAVIHNGADVSFMKTYTSLSKTNVGSTRELVKLCLPFHVPIHFVSSAGVAHLSGKTSFGEESVAIFQPPQDGTDGYTATKWASERILELVSEKFSIPVWIHRPSNITGEDAPELDIMTNILDFSKKMRKVPVSPSWQGTVDFVSVERVAADILDEVKNDSAHPGGMVKYVHECGDLEVAIDDMRVSLERQTGQEFESMSLGEWTRAAVAEGLDELVAAYLNSAAEMPFVFPKLLKANCRRPTIAMRMNEGAKRANPPKSSLGDALRRWLLRA